MGSGHPGPVGLIVSALEVLEALRARDLAALEAELGEAEAADAGGERPVTGRGRRGNEDEAAARRSR
jgi:hypothetical protein